MRFATGWMIALILAPCATFAQTDGADKLFLQQVAPVFEADCIRCHSDSQRKGGFSLESTEGALSESDSGQAIKPGKPAESFLLDYITGEEPLMPKDGKPLSTKQVAAIRTWILNGAKWPKGMRLEDKNLADLNWWSLKPLNRPQMPDVVEAEKHWPRNEIDAFILRSLREKELSPSPQADRRTLIRRLTYDLHGLPPTPAEIERFLNDTSPNAYERLVDRLLDSPRYGERWARHWLDVVHYADTHGYDKDKPRPNAWPYRDYVIRSLNNDKPYSRFVQEQLAGDVLWPGSAEGIVAVGFIAAGPWDYIGHVEVSEKKNDGKVARNLDRDDMVTSTMNTFVSFTAQCARCHNHKFDPMTMQDYYSLQAVFAAVDRANRPFDFDPAVTKKREVLAKKKSQLESSQQSLQAEIHQKAGPRLAEIDKQLKSLNEQSKSGARPEFGYHSKIEPKQTTTKWVQVDLGEPVRLSKIIIVGCHDNFNNIGAGFGFPLQYRIEASSDPAFVQNVTKVFATTSEEIPNPGVTPQSHDVPTGTTAQYIRVTAAKLAPRSNDYIFALGELFALDVDGNNVALHAKVTSLDSIEAPVRWQRKNLTDGYYYGVSKIDATIEISRLQEERNSLVNNAINDGLKKQMDHLAEELTSVDRQLAALPSANMVYAAATHFAKQGNSIPTEGKPREIRLLDRGDIKKPGEVVLPGTVGIIPNSPRRFQLSSEQSEGERRVALAEWITREDNPLTWRSIVNRVWLYHFGRGLVETPNDFGRGGSRPTHPELLDWLALEFRDGGQSLKRLHRLMVTSATYRQAAVRNESSAEVDGQNAYYWRMNRRRLTAEEVRDSVLAVSGMLNLQMTGPGYQDFVIDKPQHSPHYEYHLYDPDKVSTHRRAVYRFIVRSQPQPMMNTFDCADPNLSVAKRNETLTALQALSLMNNKFMVRMSEKFAARMERGETSTIARIQLAFQLVSGRKPSMAETRELAVFADEFGLSNACRLLLNLNEFVFLD